MSKIKVHAGDFLQGSAELSWGSISVRSKAHSIMGERIPLNQLESVDIASEESVKRVGGTIGWGAAGAVVLGPVGLLAGLLLGGRGKDVTFVALFKDGRKMLATTDNATFIKLKAAAF